jgi:biliverdin reductase
MIKVAILGSGRVAQARIRELKLRQDVQIIAVASSSLTRAKELADPISAVASTDWQSVITMADAIMICSLNQFHAQMCEVALRKGKAVSVDYPLALSLAEVERLLELAKENKTVLHVEHIDLLSPWFKVLLAALPEIGEIISISWTNLSDRQVSLSDWTFDKKSGFSLFAHEAILSRLIYIAGSPSWINSSEKLVNLVDSRFDSRITIAQIGFKNGIMAQITDGTGLKVMPVSSQLSIIGTKGQLLADKHKEVTLHLANKTESLQIPTSTGLFSQDIDNFLMQIQKNAKSYVSLEHIHLIAKLAAAAEKSCNQLQRIELI